MSCLLSILFALSSTAHRSTVPTRPCPHLPHWKAQQSSLPTRHVVGPDGHPRKSQLRSLQNGKGARWHLILLLCWLLAAALAAGTHPPSGLSRLPTDSWGHEPKRMDLAGIFFACLFRLICCLFFDLPTTSNPQFCPFLPYWSRASLP